MFSANALFSRLGSLGVKMTSPGGLNTYIQFNDAGVFGGDADFTWDKAANVLAMNGTARPQANDSAALGTGPLSWSDLFLASGGVINWANGDVTLTHSSGKLGINNPAPAVLLDIIDTADYSLAIRSSGINSAGFKLDATPGGGNAISFQSTTATNGAVGPGKFLIFDETASAVTLVMDPTLFGLLPGQVLAWNDTSPYQSGAYDLGLSRVGARTLGVGNGTAGDISGSILAANTRSRKLAATTDFYVDVAGNDANDGSIGAPWLTLQHAMDYLASSVDFGGYISNINIGGGTFQGVGVKSTVGGGSIQWRGAGSGVTIIDSGINNGTDNQGEAFSFYYYTTTVHNFNNLTLQNTATTHGVVGVYALNVLNFGLNQLNPLGEAVDMEYVIDTYPYGAFWFGDNSVVNFVGRFGGGQHTFSSSGGTLQSVLYYYQGAVADSGNGAPFVVTGSPTFTNAFLVIESTSNVNFDFISISGAFTGSPLYMFLNAAFTAAHGTGWGTSPATGSYFEGGATVRRGGGSYDTYVTRSILVPDTGGSMNGLAAQFIYNQISPTQWTELWLGPNAGNATHEFYDKINDQDQFSGFSDGTRSGIALAGGQGVLGWTAHTKYNFNPTLIDTALSRVFAAGVGVGNGTLGDVSGGLYCGYMGIGGGTSTTYWLEVYANGGAGAINVASFRTNQSYCSTHFQEDGTGGSWDVGYYLSNIYFYDVTNDLTPLQIHSPGGTTEIIGTSASGIFGWSDSARYAAPGGGSSVISGISQLAAASLAVGNGTLSDTSGTITLKSDIYVPSAISGLPGAPVGGQVAAVNDGDPGLTNGATPVNSGAGATEYFVVYLNGGWRVAV